MTKLKDLEKRLKSEPENLGLRVTVAGLLREAGRNSEAVELYRSVAFVYRDQGRKNQAIAVCRSILEIAPADVACNALLTQLAGPVVAQAAAQAAPPPEPAPTAKSSHPSIPTIPRVQTARTPSVPTRTGSSPPRRPSAPPKRVTIPPRATTDAGTPPPASSRLPTEAPPPPAAAARLPLEPPARRSSGKTDSPGRRSSEEVTPLPNPVPHHVYDRTSKAKLYDPEDLDTNPDASAPHRARSSTGTGLAEAARKITGLINREDDVAQPMDTRPVKRIRSEDLKKLVSSPPPPPTGEHIRISEEDIDTRPQEPVTRPGDALTKPGDARTRPGHDDDELTTPRDLFDPERDDR